MNVALALAALDLTVGEILSDIPRDSGAAITLLLIALFIGFVWHGSRPNSSTAEPGESKHTGRAGSAKRQSDA